MAKDRGAESQPQQNRQFISSLSKGMQVLRCFTTHGPNLSVSEISAILAMPQPTAWRICHTLSELGYLVSDPTTKNLRLGLPVLELGYSALSSLPIETLASAEMEAIARRYEGAVSLGAPDKLDMVYIQRCQGSAIVHSDLRIGSRVPMATSGTGWAYLAALPVAKRDEYFSAFQADQPELWARSGVQLKTELASFKTNGFVTNIGHLHPRINSVAVPVHSPEGRIVLSLSSGGISDVFAPDVLPEIGRELLTLSGQLSSALGGASLEMGLLPFADARPRA